MSYKLSNILRGLPDEGVQEIARDIVLKLQEQQKENYFGLLEKLKTMSKHSIVHMFEESKIGVDIIPDKDCETVYFESTLFKIYKDDETSPFYFNLIDRSIFFSLGEYKTLYYNKKHTIRFSSVSDKEFTIKILENTLSTYKNIFFDIRDIISELLDIIKSSDELKIEVNN